MQAVHPECVGSGKLTVSVSASPPLAESAAPEPVATPYSLTTFDLPAGGKRLIQRAHGYAATVKSGVVVRQDDDDQVFRTGPEKDKAVIEAIADGLRSDGLQAKLEALTRANNELARRLAAEDRP